jgi:hypothetical protein
MSFSQIADNCAMKKPRAAASLAHHGSLQRSAPQKIMSDSKAGVTFGAILLRR